MKKFLKRIVLPIAFTFLAIEAIQALTIALPAIVGWCLVGGAIYIGGRKLYQGITEYLNEPNAGPSGSASHVLCAKAQPGNQKQKAHTKENTQDRPHRKKLARWGMTRSNDKQRAA